MPVLWPGAGDFALTFPLGAGDVVDLVVQMCDISNWVASGSKHEEVADQRRNSLSDVVALPRLRSRSSPLPSGCVHPNCPVLSGNPLLLGDATASEFVALATKTITELQQIVDAYNDHTHGGIEPGTGTTASPLPQMADADPVAAEKVKAK